MDWQNESPTLGRNSTESGYESTGGYVSELEEARFKDVTALAASSLSTTLKCT